MLLGIPKLRSCTGTAIIALGALVLPGPAQSADATTATKAAQQATAGNIKVSAAFLAEVRAQAASRLRLTPAEVDALTSKLSTMNFTQVGALASGNASALRGLISGIQGPAAAATAGTSGTQGAVNQAGVGTSSGGNATQQMLTDAKNLRGGISDGGRGHARTGAKDCEACAGTVGAGSQSNTDPAADGGDPIKTQNGGKIYLYSDGSFVIQDASGKQEVYDKNYRARTEDPRWTSNKTPVPDGEGGQRSGLISAAEWRTLIGRIGSRGAPEASKSTGAGGTKATTRTTAGTPLEVSSARVVDVVQLQEVLRVAAEKFGPKVR
jgi:hypothetical protein